MSSIHQRSGLKLPRLQHVSLPIREGSQEIVRAFYGDLLGLSEKPVPTSLQHRNLVWFAVGDYEMELHFVPDTYLPNPAESRHFCLEVEDLESYRQRLSAGGYEIIEAEPIPFRPRFFCHDPFGNRLEFTTIEGNYQEV